MALATISPPAKKMKWGRWFAIAGVVAIGGGAGYWYWAAPKAAPVQYQTAPVDRGRISAKVTASGSLSALVTVLVGSQVSGRIETIGADFNSLVKKGQVIATLEQSIFQAAVEQARANHSAARANLQKAKSQAVLAEKQHERAIRLTSGQLASQADLDAAEANAQVARAQIAASEAAVAQAAAALHQAEVNLKFATIRSPIDGVVISRSIDVGQTVAASFQAPTLFTIAQDLTKMQVDTNVTEGDVGKIRPGMEVSFTVDAYPQERFVGKVRQVRDAAQTVQNVVTYDAVIDVDNSQRRLKPGMTATISFVHSEKADVLRLPNAALRFKPDGAALNAMSSASARPKGGALRPPSPSPSARAAGSRVIWVLRGEQAVAVTVQIGSTDGTATEVLDGDLHEGDRVITEAVSQDSSPRKPM